MVEAKTVHEFEASAEHVFDAWLDPVRVRSWAARFTCEDEEQENRSVVTLTLEPLARGCRATSPGRWA